MQNNDRIKETVKDKYGMIALSSLQGCGCCSQPDYSIMSDSYSGIDGYHNEADLGLGCGLPTEYANIQPGNVILDLGSGAGNDAFIASKETGMSGKVYGLDMTKAMIDKANINKEKIKASNVEFILGDIENIPLEDNHIDIIISNCVLNLVPNKAQSFNEIFRVLKPGGHFCVSDIVMDGNFPEELRKEAELYAGCISGAVPLSDYIEIINKAGFANIDIVKEKTIILPEDLHLKYFVNADSAKEFSIKSITVRAEKALN